MNRKISWVFVWILILCLTSTAAYAIPVGIFSWGEDSFFGSVFSVENFSLDSDISLGPPGELFSDVFVDLETDSGSQSLQIFDSFGNNTVAPGDSGQSIDDLSGLTITAASLRFDFPLPGTITVPILFSAGSSELIDYIPPGGPPSVPEPSTLLLVTSGLSGVALWRQIRRRS